jgi:hypothetical protein
LSAKRIVEPTVLRDVALPLKEKLIMKSRISIGPNIKEIQKSAPNVRNQRVSQNLHCPLEWKPDFIISVSLAQRVLVKAMEIFVISSSCLIRMESDIRKAMSAIDVEGQIGSQ